MQLRRMMDFAMRSSYRSLKQRNMVEHFQPLQIPELKVFLCKYTQALKITIKMMFFFAAYLLFTFLSHKYSFFQLYRLFTEVPTSPDNRGWTVL